MSYFIPKSQDLKIKIFSNGDIIINVVIFIFFNNS